MKFRLTIIAVLAAVALAVGAACSAGDAPKPRVLILDFTVENSTDAFLPEIGADALALRVIHSGAYEPIKRVTLNRELRLRYLKLPMTARDSYDLARTLEAKYLLTGWMQIATKQNPNSVRVRMEIVLHDADLEFATNGASVEVIETDPQAPVGQLPNLIRRTAADAVAQAWAKLQSTRPPQGRVQIVDARDAVDLDIGADQGVRSGMRFAVIRKAFDPHRVASVLRKMCEIKVIDVTAGDSTAEPVARPADVQPLDKVIAIYDYNVPRFFTG